MLRLALVGLAALPLCAINLHVEVEPSARITRRVLFVVDRSGSMHGDHFSRALDAVRSMLEQSTDELEFALLAFNDVPTRWPGVPETDRPRPVPPGWAALPSDTALTKANGWLEEMGAGGDTLIIPALRAALVEPRDDLSVVLVTDGLFGRERTDDIMGTIANLQEQRERDGHGRAVIACYGLGPSQKILARIGEVGGGGYVREDMDFEDEPPGLLPPTKSFR
ncbi:MAG: VWA domain-containing protein [Planctomycetes bacterium]|nr:VWA domain-containing protein [Planctomycetota bacterium]